ncbi:MAG: hypothetical protein IJ682_06785 [Lachnospiraceae bacterium]|nr:hypothetical protein [Lachnospiraceae bacterium]
MEKVFLNEWFMAGTCIFMVATGLVSLIFCLAEQDSFEMFALMAKLVTATTMALYMDMGAGWGKEITI